MPAKAPVPAVPLPRPRARKTVFTFIDLFAGIGGFNLGMSSNGGTAVFANEWDKHARQTYAAWYGDEHLNGDDIRSLNYAVDVPDHDILCGGFPCQPFSIAGVSKKNSMGRPHGFDDVKQGNLFFAICAMIEAKRPDVLVLENVKNLKSHDKGNTFKVITENIDALGYELHHQIIDARAWVPQHRERIFLVGFNRDVFTPEEAASFRFPTPPPAPHPVLSSILDVEAPPEKYMLTDGLWAYLQRHAADHKAKGNGFGYQMVTGEDVSRTLSARYYKDGSEILIHQDGWRNPRRLTPQEASRLMGFSAFSEFAGFPDGFPQVVSDMQSYKQYGNSVSPLVVEAVGREVVKVLKKQRKRLLREQAG